MVSRQKKNLGTMVPAEVREAFDAIVEQQPPSANRLARCLIASVVLLHRISREDRQRLLSEIAATEQTGDWRAFFAPADDRRIAAKEADPMPRHPKGRK